MTCLHCGRGLGETYAAYCRRPEEFMGGVFRGPACKALHVRRAVGTSAEGETLYSIRLWGRPSAKAPAARVTR